MHQDRLFPRYAVIFNDNGKNSTLVMAERAARGWLQIHTGITEVDIEQKLMKNRGDGVGVGYAAMIAEDRVANERRVPHGTLQHTRHRNGDDVGETPQRLPEGGIRNLEPTLPSP